jgi:cytochrome c
MKISSGLTLIAACSLMAASFANAGRDDEAVEALLKKSACLTCHATEKKKVGTAFKEVAKKYKGRADAEDTLIKHLTTKPLVEMDGNKVEHMAIKSNDPAEIRDAVKWILSR